MNPQTECDVLVVGAGPAGSSAAQSAARSGADVILIDKRSEIGRPVQCAEYVPKPLAMEVTMSVGAIAQEVAGTETYIGWDRKAITGAPGWILNREVFDSDLARAAADSGAKLVSRAKAIERTKHGVVVLQDGDAREITCKVIVGADGPISTVGDWIGERNERMVCALQSTVPLARPMRYCQVYFTQEFEGGYGWVFPKGGSANVGVGVIPGKQNLRELLDGFLQRLEEDEKIVNEETYSTAGLIPVGGPLNTVVSNTVLVGDAAGQTHPITGAGIPQAVLCGKMAGRVAARSVSEIDPGILRQYEKEWMALYDSTLAMASRRREEMEQGWGGRDFSGLIRRSWIGFKEYTRTA